MHEHPVVVECHCTHASVEGGPELVLPRLPSRAESQGHTILGPTNLPIVELDACRVLGQSKFRGINPCPRELRRLLGARSDRGGDREEQREAHGG